MELMTREEVKTKYKIPLGSIDTRMKELGVEPHLPPKKGRGWAVLYDGIEIDSALRNEREKRVAIREKRQPSLRVKPADDFMSLSWREAKARLTNHSPTQ